MTVSRSVFTVIQRVMLVVIRTQSHFATFDSLQFVRANMSQSIFRVNTCPVPQRPQICVVHEISILYAFGLPF
jgi:hypothetical protein